MRDDIVGMLKNAIEHGGNPARVAQSLVNSGYPTQEVQQALSYITSLMPQSTTPQIPQTQNKQTTSLNTEPQSTSPQQIQMPTPPTPIYKSPETLQIPSPPQQFMIKPLPSSRSNPESKIGKLILMIFVLLVLVGSLISVIIFKDNILDLLS